MALRKQPGLGLLDPQNQATGQDPYDPLRDASNWGFSQQSQTNLLEPSPESQSANTVTPPPGTLAPSPGPISTQMVGEEPRLPDTPPEGPPVPPIGGQPNPPVPPGGPDPNDRTTPNTPTGFSRDTWNQLITQYPGTVAGLRQLVQDHPELGLKIVGGSQGDIEYTDADGKVHTVDVIISAGTGGTGWQWLEGDTGGGGGNIDDLIRRILESRFGPGANYDLFMQYLRKILEEESQPLGPVENTPQAQAYRVAAQRSAEFERSAMAERLAAEGMGAVGADSGAYGAGSGALSSEIMGINQNRAERTASYEAQLSERLLTERKDRLMRALDMGAGWMNAQDQLRLQDLLRSTNSALELLKILLAQYNQPEE